MYRCSKNYFQALQAAGFTLKHSFGTNEVKYLGHVLSIDGIRLGDDHNEVIVDLVPEYIVDLVPENYARY